MISWWIPQGSTYAPDVDFVIALIGVLVGFWFILTEGIFFYFIFRYRAKNAPKAEYLTGDEEFPKKYITWAHLAVLVCDVAIIVYAVQVWYDVKQNLPEPQATIRVVGQQWAWSFQSTPAPTGSARHRGRHQAPSTTLLPRARTSSTTTSSRSRDVLHNFSVPVFRLKQDAIPGRVDHRMVPSRRSGR